MTTLLTADLHLNDLERDAYRWAFLEQKLPKLVQDFHCGCVLLLGDLTEQKDRHPAALVNRVADGLQALARQAHVIWLLGNHDYLDREQPFFRAVAALAGVEAITEPTRRKNLSTVKSEAWGPVCFLPHARDWEKEWQAVRFDAATTYFAHNTFKGARTEHGKELRGIPLDVFPPGARCFSGDVHVPQRVGPVTYVGAPYLIDYGDRFQPRVLLLNEGKASTLKLQGPGKHLVEATRPSDVMVQLGRAQDWHPGDLLKVRIRLGSKDYARWPELRQQVLDWGAKHKVAVQAVPSVDPATVNQRIRDTGQTDEELLAEYGKHRGIDARTLHTGRLLMEEAG